MTDFKKLKVVELRTELSKRGLPQTGKRDELIERLEEYEFQHAEPSDMEVDQEMVTELPIPVTEIVQQEKIPSPITEPETIVESSQKEHPQVDVDLEEERRRARAIRFGLNSNEVAKVDITVAIMRLDHALPNRRPFKNHRKNHQLKIVKN